MPQTVLSTGVMLREADAFNANVTVVNLDTKKGRTVTVEIFDWGVEQVWSTPKPVAVSPAGATTVGPHTQRDFIALITESTAQPSAPLTLYEIRVTVDDINDVVINCYALTNEGQTIPAKTFKHKDLVVISAL
jgi:hypothetical protein